MRTSHILSGIVGFCVAMLACVGIFEWKIAPAVQQMHDMSIHTLADATTREASCQARFAKATVLYDLTSVPSAREPRQMRQLDNGIQMFGGIIELAPGRAMRDGYAQRQRIERPRVAWYIPADVEPTFYGNPADAFVVHFDPVRHQALDSPHPPVQYARLQNP